jgi:hypothetical protein
MTTLPMEDGQHKAFGWKASILPIDDDYFFRPVSTFQEVYVPSIGA